MTRKLNDAFLAGPRPVRPRAWQVLATGGAIAMATAPVLAQGFYLPTTAPAAEGGWLWQAQAEGGEGGEAGGTASGDATVDFLAGLLQIEGHLASKATRRKTALPTWATPKPRSMRRSRAC